MIIDFYNLFNLYILRYCLLGFYCNGFLLKLLPFSGGFEYRFINGCNCCNMFLFDLKIGYVLEISLHFSLDNKSEM